VQTCSISTLPPPHRRKKSSQEDETITIAGNRISRISTIEAKKIGHRLEGKLLRQCSICTHRQITRLLLRDVLPAISSIPSTAPIRQSPGNLFGSSSTCRRLHSKKAALFVSTHFRVPELPNAVTAFASLASFVTCIPTRPTIPTRNQNAPVAPFLYTWSTFGQCSSSL
jgi:hypothetical protein